VERVLCFPSAASFPRSDYRSGRLQPVVLILFAAGQHGPGHASELVGDGDHHFVARCTLGQPTKPLPESSGIVFDAKQYSPSPVDQHATQIAVATLADAEQLLLTSGGVLSWDDTHPGGEVTPASEGCSVSDGGHSSGRD
jgi:hypothetical protein